MKVIFAGPSLHGARLDLSGLELRGPAACGDVLRAVLDGTAVIGLIDGNFEATASVWHKEILYALQHGVRVVGGASMGALRAAECAAFGMDPVGRIAARYLDGDLDDDAAVAVTHGPPELGSPPLTEALVDVEFTIDLMRDAGAISVAEGVIMREAARRCFFKERTVNHLARLAAPGRAAAFEELYAAHRVSLKTLDAIEVINRVRALPASRVVLSQDWSMNEPPTWREVFKAASP